jgi:hypothetical protein
MYNYDDFPIQNLPPSLLKPLLECHQNIQAPVALNVASMFASASIATQGLWDVELPNGLVCPISLMFFSIADSGERKTATDKVFSNAIREFEAAQAEQFKQQDAAHQAAMMAWDQKKQVLEQALRKAALQEVQEVLNDSL